MKKSLLSPYSRVNSVSPKIQVHPEPQNVTFFEKASFKMQLVKNLKMKSPWIYSGP